MRVRILGAHNVESRSTRLPGLLVDDVLALDAGGLTSSLTLTEQAQVRAILLTHRHYDHVRDLPLLALATLEKGESIQVYGIEDTCQALEQHLLGTMYPDFRRHPSPENPKVRLHIIRPFHEFTVEGYRVMAVPVPHGAPSVGYGLTTPEGRTLFYTGDVGPGLASAWEHLAPEVLVVEVTFSDEREAQAREVGHLTPSLLARELEPLRERGGAYPWVIAVHMYPPLEGDIQQELMALADRTGIRITPAYEGMTLEL